MPLKQLGIFLAVVIVGVSVAMCFRKDSSPLSFLFNTSDDPFGTHVERRVGGAFPPPAIPAPATAAITQPEPAMPQAPAFHQTYRPVGTLLAPLDSVQEQPREVTTLPAESSASSGFSYGGVTRHTVADGDTLTRLAQLYLGRADAYLEIYEANRGVLTTPDLLPIGAVLVIPSRASIKSPSESYSSDLAPVPGRPQY
jgi:nucleoid-associated protein YgaU